MHRALLFILILLPITGCKKPMVLPAIFEAGEVNPFDETRSGAHPNQFDIFYVTDRQYERGNEGKIRYTKGRADTLSIGRARLQFGGDNDWPHIVAEVRDQPGGKRYVPDLIAMSRIGSLDQQTRKGGRPGPWLDPESQAATEFIKDLNTSLTQSSGKAVTLYIHGFNTGFKQAARVTAEYDLYTGGLGPFILYSWPSYNDLFEYSYDRDSVRYTSSNARRLIAFLADRINAGKLDAKQINLIAHSTGAEVVGSVLRELALLSYQLTPQERAKRWRIGSVLLIAPDISTDVARERLLKEDVAGTFRQLAVYGSGRDKALRWASRVLYGTSRIGSINEADLSDSDRHRLAQAPQIALVDVDSAGTNGFINHAHHRFSPAVASDIILSLRTHLGPAERGLTREQGHAFWTFPKDYKQRATDAAIKAYAQDEKPIDQQSNKP